MHQDIGNTFFEFVLNAGEHTSLFWGCVPCAGLLLHCPEKPISCRQREK